jgi:hypothetical protein
MIYQIPIFFFKNYVVIDLFYIIFRFNHHIDFILFYLEFLGVTWILA